MSKTIRIKVYKFDELNAKAKEKAISDQIDLEAGEMMDEHSPYYYLWEEMDRLQTPWFLGQEIYKKHKDDIIATIKLNKSFFYKDGRFYPGK